MDKDGDFVRCFQTINIAAGEFHNIAVPGISVLEDCSVEIAALSKYGYKNEDWIAVLVTVRDFPRTDVLFGNGVYQTALFAFSETSLQFAVNVKDVLDVPEFIYPTPPAKQEFYLYIGVSWKITVFAKTSENTTIDSFAVMGIDKETYEISPVKNDPDGRENVKFAELKWAPSDSDIGPHLACITATDLTGIVSQIHVRDAYVRTASIGLVSKVTVNGEVFYKADLSFQHPKNDEVQICLQAEDVNNLLSDELCFTTKIIPPGIDNCPMDKPCNDHGLCIDGVRTYTCKCFSRYYGDFCEHDNCPTNPQGDRDCTNAAPACSPTCGSHGICVNSHCQCSLGFAGPNCTSRSGVLSNAANIKFIDPTLKNGGKLVCYLHMKEIQNCELQVFIQTKTGQQPTLTVSSSPALSNSTFSPVNTTLTIEGLDHVFASLISVKGTLNMNERSEQYICVDANIGNDSDSVCMELDFLSEPGTSKAAVVRFINPTPQAHSVFRCMPNTMCNFLLYTTFDIPCNQVSSVMSEVTVQSPQPYGQSACVSEVGFEFATEGQHDICFMSANSDYQEICFTVDVYRDAADPCKSTPCKNNGHCFRNTSDTFVCRCMDGYTGHQCEKGPCRTSDNHCQNDGACFIDANTATCVCKAGFSGLDCRTNDIQSNPMAFITGANFIPSTMPTDVNCNRNRKCGFSVNFAGIFQKNERPLVVQGYVSAPLEDTEIKITQLPASGSFLSSVSFLPVEIGNFVMCLQTLNKQRINKDEVCIKIHVIDGVSYVYGDSTKPHFIFPSLQPDSKMECKEGTSCHVIYTVTPGVGHELSCVDVKVEKTDIEHIHVFSDCDPCTEGSSTNGNCTVDLAFRPDSGDTGNKLICLATARTVFQQLAVAMRFLVNMEHFVTVMIQMIPSTVEVDVGFVTPNLIVGDIQMSGTSDCKTGTAKLIATETGEHRFCIQSSKQGPSIIDSSPELVEGVHVFEPEQVTGECTSDITYIAPSSMSTGDSFKLCLTVAIPGDQVRQCGNGLPGSHVFTTNLVDNACVTDISYHTSTSTVMPLCVTAGAKGEQRTFLIETKITNEVNECESNPCKNGGSCTDLESSFAYVDECFQVGGGSPCQHGGQCVNDNSMYICNCSNTGYTGKNCQNGKVQQ
ncbi:uncharacterized protein LOC128208313 [Mya arenaria]|uniref:uncharacterized protein LOC128208313 n=1 Tax=Mya arenaria TaxID=6604 RepID=UPI0022E48B2B|nr:uncharacterized protein LOC128208313 [Mya arenaria]